MFVLTCEPGHYPGPVGHRCTYFDWSWFGLMMVALVIVTILVDWVFEIAEEAAEEGGAVAEVLYQKVIKELALLGVVSFISVLLQNIPQVKRALNLHGGYAFLMFELAHVELFAMAVLFVVMVYIVYRRAALPVHTGRSASIAALRHASPVR